MKTFFRLRGGANLLTQIALVGCAFLVQGCDLFSSPSAQDNNPFRREALEVFTVHAPRVALDGNGNATVLYYEQTSLGDEQRIAVRAQRFNLADSAPSPAATLDENTSAVGPVATTVVASDASSSLAFFVSHGPQRCRYTETTGWSCEAQSYFVHAAEMDGAGRVITLSEDTRNVGTLIGQAFTPAGGWTAVTPLASDSQSPNTVNEGRDERYTLSFWSGGAGYATWLDSSRNIRVSQYLAATDTWEPAQLIGVGVESAVQNGYVVPKVALARNAPSFAPLLVWTGMTGRLEYSQNIPGQGWLTPQTIPQTTPQPQLTGIDVAMSDNGDAMLLALDTVALEVRAYRFHNGAWEAPQIVGPIAAYTAPRPRVVMDRAGNALAVWYDNKANDFTTSARLRINHYSAGQGWQGAEEIGASALQANPFDEITGTNVGDAFPEDVTTFDVDMDAAGRALVAWIGRASGSNAQAASRLRTYATGLFRLSVTPSLTVLRDGGNGAATISIQRDALTADVTLQVLDCPTNAICTLGRTVLPGDINSTTLTFFTNNQQPVAAGDYDIRVRAVGGAQTSEGVIRVTMTGGEPPATDVTLTVNVTGAGRVISTPMGVDCVGTQVCNATFARNQSVTLSAVASSGQVFSGFGGDADCSDGALVMSADTSCVATFVAATGEWSGLDAALNVSSLGTASYLNTPEIEIGADGMPVAAFIEGEAVIVRRFNGTLWQSLGEPLNSQTAIATSLTIDGTGAPTVAWEEIDSQNNTDSHSVFAARWSGSAWVRLGPGAADIDALADARSPCIRALSNGVAMTWVESSQQADNRVVVRIWNGTAWINAGATEGPSSIALLENLTPKIAVAPNDSLAVAWANGLDLHVAELIGNTWTSTPMPVPQSNGGSTFMLDIAYSNSDGLLFVAQMNNGGTFTVRRWSNNTWSDFGSVRGATDLPGGNPRIFGLAFSHGRSGSLPLLAYGRRDSGGALHQFIVDRFSGSDWSRLGAPIAPLSRHDRPGLEFYVGVADGAIPHVATQVIGNVPNAVERDDSLRVYRFQ